MQDAAGLVLAYLATWLAELAQQGVAQTAAAVPEREARLVAFRLRPIFDVIGTRCQTRDVNCRDEAAKRPSDGRHPLAQSSAGRIANFSARSPPWAGRRKTSKPVDHQTGPPIMTHSRQLQQMAGELLGGSWVRATFVSVDVSHEDKTPASQPSFEPASWAAPLSVMGHGRQKPSDPSHLTCSGTAIALLSASAPA
jgi:hypothetical protein